MESSSSDTRNVPLSVSQRTLHVTDADEEDESVKQLNECATIYLSLQDCLVESNRNWKACQAQVQALKACQAKRNKNDQT
jgi:cytochrome c oxidase assembly factor 4